MYSVMIVEDSKPILRDLVKQIKSVDSRLKIVETATDGNEALEKIKKHEINILFTDIRMPFMDGLKLIEEAKKIHPSIQTVIISGYNDFDYARQAIDLRVNKYILKPVDNNELKKVIDEIIAELDLASNIKMEKKLNMLIKKLESNDNYSELPINAYRFLIVRSGPLKNGSDRIEKTVLDEVLRSMQPYANYWTLETGYPCELVILFNLSVNDDSKMDLNYTELLEKLCKKHRQINIFISPVLNDISSLNKEYRDLSNFFSCLITIGCSQVFTAESKQTLQLYKLNEEALSIQHKFRFIIKNRQKGSYKNELRKCTNKWRIEKHPVIFIQRFITVILDEINKICYDLNQDVLPDIITIKQ
jgi:two-component system response regulator YesN